MTLHYQYNIKYTSDKNKEKYQLGDYKLIQSQILQTNIARTVWQTVGRINEVLGVKGLKMQLVKEILIAFVGSSAQASGIISFYDTSEFSLFSYLVPKLRREDEARCEGALFGMRTKVP